MNRNPRRLVLLSVIALLFAAVSARALWEFGYVELWKLPFTDWGTRQLFMDLTIAMVLVTSWMWRDSRQSGVPFWPYVVATLLTGSFGPLGYLIHRELRAKPAAPA